jgi:hypothetical protein
MNPMRQVVGPPRIKPISTRDYGKGGTPYSGSPDMGLGPSDISYPGSKPYGTY